MTLGSQGMECLRLLEGGAGGQGLQEPSSETSSAFSALWGPLKPWGGPFPEGQSKPKSLGLCVFQSLGSSLVSLYQAFRRQPLWMSDGPWARPFLYANPRKLFTRFAHLGDLSPLLPNLGWDSRRQCVLSSCVEGGVLGALSPGGSYRTVSVFRSVGRCLSFLS